MSWKLEGNDHENQEMFLPQDEPGRKYHYVDQYILALGGRMSQPASNQSLRRRIYGLVKPDWMFAVNFFIGTGLLILETRDPTQLMDAQWSPLAVAGAAIGLTFLLSSVATIVAALDRRGTDDYHFQLMANGAIIAVLAAIFVNLAWLMAAPVLGTMTAPIMIGILLLAWSLGYFLGRWRGINR